MPDSYGYYRVRVRVRWNGTAYSVALPEYIMVPDSFLPLIPGLVTLNGVDISADPNDPRLNGLSCLCEVPDRICDSLTHLPDTARICSFYKGNPKWDRPDLELPLIAR